MTTKCPRNRRPIDECPRKVYTGLANACQPCIDQHRECVAVVPAALAEHARRASEEVPL